MKIEPNCFVEVASRKEMINYYDELSDGYSALANAVNIKGKAAGAALFCLLGLWWASERRINRLEREIEKLKEEHEEE